MRFYLILLNILLSSFAYAQPKTDPLLKNILQNINPAYADIINNPDTFRLQIIYTQIDRDKNNTPTFRHFYFNYDDKLYFNPASTVKLPMALLALEKINRMRMPEITKHTSMLYDSSYDGQVVMHYDSTSETLRPSIAHFIKKAFLVSDNDAYNRMYQFVGQGDINRWLQEKKYTRTRIIRQFMGFRDEQNRWTNTIHFVDKSGKVIHTLPATRNTDTYDFSRSIKVGRGHLNSRDSLNNAPINFSRANIVGLGDLQRILQAVLFPESVPAQSRFFLTTSDQELLLRYLSQYPSETNYPKYDTSEYYDSYVKFFFRGTNRKMPPNVRVFNKVGWSYGFLTDVSYVADFKNNIEYMLTATVYVNQDAILNDNKYEYEKVGWPFLYEVGQLIYQHDLKRKRKVVPDLSKFKLKYEVRNDDARPVVKGVDN